MAIITAADGTELYVRDWGSGRPVVLIHGWPLSGASWENQAVPLAEAGYRVIAYDRRGFGRSGQPWGGHDYDTLADDLAAVIDGLRLEGAALYGFSMGGGEVARYMSRHEGRGVAKAGLVASIAPGLLKGPGNQDGAGPEVFEGMMDGLRADRAEFMRGFARAFYGQGTAQGGVSEGVLDWHWGTAMQASLRATIECVRAFGFTDFTADMPALAGVPVQVLHGTGDEIVPIGISGHRVKQAIPAAELVEYEGAPHGLLATHAEAVTRDMLAFLK